MDSDKKKEPDVSKHAFAIAYDGSKLPPGQHSIDVQSLGPALLAIGKLIREANTEFNGKKSTAKVLVVSDFEHKCFNINFELAVSLYEQVKTFLGIEHVKTAKEVLEWLGLLGLPAGGALSYLVYLRVKNGRKVEEVTPLISDVDETGVVQVKFQGDGNKVEVHNHVYQLSENPRALRATRDAFLPLGHDGYDQIKVTEGDKVVAEIKEPDVEAIVASCNVGIETALEKEIEPEIEVTPAWLSVYSPVYDASASMWRFRLGKDVIYADISETSIEKEALDRGFAAAEDSYQVQLEVTTPFDSKGGQLEPTYKILEVIRFVPAAPVLRQGDMFNPDTQQAPRSARRPTRNIKRGGKKKK